MLANAARRFVYGLVCWILVGCGLAGCQGTGGQPARPGTFTATPILTATVIQTATLTPTFTPPAPPTLIAPQPPATRPALPCRDGLSVVMNLNFEPGADGALPVIPATSQIEKGWRVRNSGTCTWDSAYVLALTENAPDWVQSSQTAALSASVKPGEMYDFWVQVAAPQSPGSYQAEWRLRNGRGRNFGEPLTLGFEVAPIPTGTPAPEVDLVAEPLEVYAGQEARIAWTTHQAKEAYFYRLGQAWREHPVEVNGSAIVHPDRTTTYELRVVKGDDTVEIRRITIEILPFEAPEIRIFRLFPGNVIDLGQCVTIRWRVTGRVSSLTVFRDGVEYWSSLDEDGEVTDCPGSRRVIQYLLKAVGPGGEAQAERQLEVR